MKIIVLHLHGICPHCNKLSCIYADFYRDDDGVKLQVGFECDSCHSQISNEEFDTIELVEVECPKGEVKLRKQDEVS